MNSDYNYRFSACRLMQGGRHQYISSVPYKILRKLFPKIFEESALKRSQRELNKKHASDVGNYIYDAAFRATPYILPTLVASIDGECFFEPASGQESVGILNVPMETEISCFDGQHRIEGIFQAISRMKIEDSISVLFVADTTIQIRQQFFSDINKNSLKPSKSLCMAYDRKNATERSVFSLYEALNRPGFIDLDHNVVPATSNNSLSYKQFYDATRLMFDSKIPSVDFNDFLHLGSEYWKHWFTAMQYDHNFKTGSTVDYKKSYIGYHGIFVTAWAMTVARLRKHNEYDDYQITAAMHHFWINFGAEKFKREAWYGICVDEKTKRIDLSVESKLSVTDLFYDVIEKKLLELKRQ
ncbi:DGQHR domain [Yersinia intermedia]|nr:DGQHR domain [Yersinia intermedia]